MDVLLTRGEVAVLFRNLKAATLGCTLEGVVETADKLPVEAGEIIDGWECSPSLPRAARVYPDGFEAEDKHVDFRLELEPDGSGGKWVRSGE